jgi:hypothetical protein
MWDAGEARRQEKLVRRVEVELEAARGAIAQSNARRDELELQLRNEQQQLLLHQQQQQQLRIRIDELVRRCDDAATVVADAKSAAAAAAARADEAEVNIERIFGWQKYDIFIVQGDCRTLLKDNKRLQECAEFQLLILSLSHSMQIFAAPC